nr:ABC transporter [Leptinotarsa decemlineata]
MGKRRFSPNAKNKHPLEADFVKNEEEGKENEKTVSYIQMFRYTTGLDKFLLCLGLLSALGTGILQPLYTLLYGNLTGDIIAFASTIYKPTLTPEQRKEAEDNFLDGITHFAVMNSLIGLGMLVLSFISTTTFTYSASRQVYQLRSVYLSKILNQDISWYDVHETGDFSSRMTEDLYKFEDGIGEKLPMFLHFQVVFLASLTLALWKGWELALVCLTSLPAALIALGVVSFLTTRFAQRELDAYGAAGAIAEEVLSSIRTVVAFSGQEKEAKRYDKNLEFAKKNNIKKNMFSGIGTGMLWFMIYSSYALAFWYGVKLVLDQKTWTDPVYTVNNMVTVFFSVMAGSMNFGIASPYIEAFAMSKAAANKIFSVIDNIPKINLSKGRGEKLDSVKGNIRFRNVKFHYPSRPDVPILQGLNLEINQGDTVALVGSSGCGKSTVIQLIQRFYDPVSGEISVDGKNIKDLDLTWFRGNIGTVGQEPVLFGISIMENIKYGNLKATEEDVIAAAKKANAHTFISALPNGYNTLVGERGAQLSGGQKQRIAIARALVGNPSILLLDEATSALDYTSEAKVQAALDSASAGYTTIIVAHRLSTIRGANKIIVFSKGVVVEQGTHEELMALEKEYHGLVMAQVRGSEAAQQSGDGKKIIEVDEDDKIDPAIHGKTIADEEIQENETDLSLIGILKMNSPEWLQLLIGSTGSAVLGTTMPLFSVLFGSILGTLASSDDDYVRSETNKYCLFFVCIGFMAAVCNFLLTYMFGIAGERMTERIRSQMFRAMLVQEIGFFDDKANGVGSLCSRLSADASSIQGATGQRLGSILQSITTFVVAISLSLYYDYRLGLVTAAFVPFMLLAMYVERQNTAGLRSNRDQALQKSTMIAVEAVGNIRTVASLCLEDQIHKLYTTELIPYYRSVQRNVYWRGIVFGLSRSMTFFTYSASMYYGGRLVINGLSYEKVFKVSQALVMGTTSIANSLAFSPNLTAGLEAAKNVKQFLARVPKIQDSSTSKSIQQVDGNFDFSRINFSYPTRSEIQVLKGLNLSILQGKTVALVGQSGCGKSTIIQLIERFYDPSSGEVKLDGNNLKSMKLESLRSHLGIVSQEPNLFNKTIAENIAYGDNSREADMNEIMQAARNANIHNFIVDLPKGYDTKLGEKAVQLSGGQKQRIAIARALVRNPKVLLLDEATSALDTESEKIVQEALDKAKQGRTCVTIAHRLTTIQDADLICVIDRGIVAEAGTHEELLNKKGLYHRLNQAQK